MMTIFTGFLYKRLFVVFSFNLNVIKINSKPHQKNVSVKCLPPQTPLSYCENGVFRGNPIFLIFDPKHRLCILVRTVSARRFYYVYPPQSMF